MFLRFWVEVDVNFFRGEKLCRRDYLDYLKNRAKCGDMAVLQLTFRNVSLESGQKIDPATSVRVWPDFCPASHGSNAGRRTKFDPGKSLWFFELFLELSLFEFRFTVLFTLGCGVISGHLSGEGINVTFLHPHEPQLSAMRCVTLNQIDPTYMICVRSFVVLCPHYSTLPLPLPFRCDKISRKGEFSDRFCAAIL